jgi:hypothetical protein
VENKLALFLPHTTSRQTRQRSEQRGVMNAESHFCVCCGRRIYEYSGRK